MLLGFVHLPSPSKRIGFVFCHPFAEEKNCCHVIIAQTAREMAKQGYPVFRFDMSGCGDSEGELEQATVDQWIEDIDCAIDVFKTRTGVEKVVLWGLRFGSGLAFHYAERHIDQCSSLLLWQPIFDFPVYFKHFMLQGFADRLIPGKNSDRPIGTLVAKIAGGETIEVGGYPISPTLYNSILQTGSVLASSCRSMDVCIACLSQMNRIPAVWLRTAEELKSQGNRVELQHTRVEPFWDRYWRWHEPGLSNGITSWLHSVK